MSDFALAEPLAICAVPIGDAGEVVLVIDNAMADWRELVRAAAAARFAPVAQGTGYPGLRAPLPRAYATGLLRCLQPAITQHFFPGEGVRLQRFDCNFSLVTLPAERLHPLQRVPHVDLARPDRIAILHFLCGEEFGGTAFYRQTRTGLATVGPATRTAWLAARAADMAALPPGGGYPSSATPGYTQMASFPARHDRILVYRSHSLHSGLIPQPDMLLADPERGRLTANFFCTFI